MPRASILVIENDEDNIRLVDYVLRAHGYEPLLATDGADGLRIALEQAPDLVLIDIRMPRMDGYEVAERLKQADLAATKVVAVTAPAMVRNRKQIAAAGFHGYIEKPIDPETFIAAVETFLPASAA